MSWYTTVTMYQLVCDGCGYAREVVEKDEVDDDRVNAIDFDGWNEVEDGIYCDRCSWGCRCGKAFQGSPPPAEMCAECERNRYGRLIDAMPDWEPCPGSGAAVGPWRDGSSMPCAYCPAVCVPAVATPWQLTLDDHLRRRMYNPIAFGQGTQIRDLWTNDVFEVVKHDSRTGMTELAAFGNGLVHLVNSNNNARYVAVREEA
jgi:hypothetical protein